MSDAIIEEAFAKLPLFEQERLIEKLHSSFKVASRAAKEADEELFSLERAAILVKAYRDGDEGIRKLFDDLRKVERYIDGVQKADEAAWTAAFGDFCLDHPLHDAIDRAWTMQVPLKWDDLVTSGDDTGLDELVWAYRAIFPDSKLCPEITCLEGDDYFSWQSYGQTVKRELNWNYVLRDEERITQKVEKLKKLI
jgi:hypothetical protein